MSAGQPPPSRPPASPASSSRTKDGRGSPSLSSASRIAIGRIIAVDPQTDPRWEAFVAAHPDGLIYHHPRWLQVIEKAYGGKLIAFACENADGQLRGVLPLFHTRGLLTGYRVSSLPHTPVAGPLALDDESTAALAGEAVKWVQAKRGARLQLKVAQAGLDKLVDNVVGLPWEETYALELPTRPQDLHFGNSRNHARIKWAINKAAKLGVQVRDAATEGELCSWYKLYLDTMRSHAVPPRPYRFFKVAWELLSPHGEIRLLLAEQHQGGQSKLLAGSIFLMFGHTVVYAFNGRRREALSLRPNDVIQWQAIRDACKDGFRHYDFGEVEESNQGLAEFKGKWGAEPRRLYRYYCPAPHELETGILQPNSVARQCANALWRRLPLKATAVLGDWLYSHL
jgi:Acetyltransferase (GNAT) domain